MVGFHENLVFFGCQQTILALLWQACTLIKKVLNKACIFAFVHYITDNTNVIVNFSIPDFIVSTVIISSCRHLPLDPSMEVELTSRRVNVTYAFPQKLHLAECLVCKSRSSKYCTLLNNELHHEYISVSFTKFSDHSCL